MQTIQNPTILIRHSEGFNSLVAHVSSTNIRSSYIQSVDNRVIQTNNTYRLEGTVTMLHNGTRTIIAEPDQDIDWSLLPIHIPKRTKVCIS